MRLIIVLIFVSFFVTKVDAQEHKHLTGNIVDITTSFIDCSTSTAYLDGYKFKKGYVCEIAEKCKKCQIDDFNDSTVYIKSKFNI